MLVTISGQVEKGVRRGSELGFPTLNLCVYLPDTPFGVYAATVMIRGECYQGVANYGITPMFKRPTPLLEVHVFNFAQTIYGETVHVSLVGFIRPERLFPHVSDLIAAIEDDCMKAKETLYCSTWNKMKKIVPRGTK